MKSFILHQHIRILSIFRSVRIDKTTCNALSVHWKCSRTLANLIKLTLTFTQVKPQRTYRINGHSMVGLVLALINLHLRVCINRTHTPPDTYQKDESSDSNWDETAHESGDRLDTPPLKPGINLIAVVVSDLCAALTTFNSMAMRNNVDFDSDPSEDDPHKDIKERVRTYIDPIVCVLREMNSALNVAMREPRLKSEQEMICIQASMKRLFLQRGRILTAEVWIWISIMARSGCGEMLGSWAIKDALVKWEGVW